MTRSMDETGAGIVECHHVTFNGGQGCSCMTQPNWRGVAEALEQIAGGMLDVFQSVPIGSYPPKLQSLITDTAEGLAVARACIEREAKL